MLVIIGTHHIRMSFIFLHCKKLFKNVCHDSDAENIFVGGSFGTEGTLEFIPFATLDL